MAQKTDIVLSGAGYTLAAEKYTRSQDGAAEGRSGRVAMGDFFGGLRRHVQLERDRAFDGVRVGPVLGGQGVRPWGSKTAGLAMPGTAVIPTISKRVPTAMVRGRVYFALGGMIYECPASGSPWTTPSGKIDTGTSIVDLCLYSSNGMLATFGTGKDVTWYRASDGNSSVLLAGEQGHSIGGYGGYAIWVDARSGGRPTYLRQVTGTQVDLRILDYDVRRLINAGARIYAVTDSAIYSYTGRVEERNIANPGYVADPDPRTIKILEWSGNWSPFFQHGISNAADDFALFEGFGGKIYAWIAGEAMEYTGEGERAGWRATGLTGRRCFGGCVSGGYVIVSIESHGGMNQLWAWDGSGWWKLDERAIDSNPWVWPLDLNNAGNYDLMVFRAGTRTYDLYRLRPRAGVDWAIPSEAASFLTPLIDAGERDRVKAWRRVGAVFATPERLGNLSSADAVQVHLDYSVDAGATWATAGSLTISGNTPANAQRTLEAGIASAVSPFVMLRVRWSSLVDWAPVLVGVWVEFEVLDSPTRRRKWAFSILASDQAVDRDGNPLARSGRDLITDLWAAWESGAPVSFRDIDYDAAPIERTVRIVGIAERVNRPADHGRWGQAVIDLALVEI